MARSVAAAWLALVLLVLTEGAAADERSCPEGPEVPCEGRQSGGRSWAMLPSTSCLEDLVLRGVVKGRMGYRALFESKVTVPPKTFVLEVGSELFDARVLEIGPDAVVLRQVPGSPPDQRRCRRITRRLTDRPPP